MNQLAIRENINLAPSESEFRVMKEQSEMLIKSKFLPNAIQTPEQAVAIILTGRELGIGTMQALNNIVVIQGKPTVSPQLMLALIQRSGQLENVIIQNKFTTDGALHHVSCMMKRKGMHEHTEIFGAAEANKMGLLNKDNYKKQPGTMFKWRAVAACARVVFPDVILGFYTPEEMGEEITETGELIEPVPMETQKNTVIRMPQAKPIEEELETVQTIAAEPVFDEPKADYTDQWNQALANSVKKDRSVTPETKGRLLYEAGFVKPTANGFEVVDQAEGEFFTVTKPGGKIQCTCADFAEGREKNATYRCGHIEAVKLHLVRRTEQKQAA